MHCAECPEVSNVTKVVYKYLCIFEEKADKVIVTKLTLKKKKHFQNSVMCLALCHLRLCNLFNPHNNPYG